MFSEKQAHLTRWLLLIGWLTLILGLFWDPLTLQWTEPNATWSVFHLKPDVFLNPDRCVKIRETCVVEIPFSLTTLIWWAMIVPASILVLMTLGHEFWRRICPLSFASQLPRALGIQRFRRITDSVTGQSRREVVMASQWLERNHLYLQFGLFVLGLGARLQVVNGHRVALGCFLLATILCAILVGFLFGGKSWCQYFCPMSPVQMVYTGPRSIFGSKSHLQPRGSITQSMCRTIDQTGSEQSACVACKKSCIDIDSEKTYWEELNKPGRCLIQYGYPGMVLAFYGYFYLYSGNWSYYFSGKWAHEEDVLSKLFDPGFYINGTSIPIPKVLAVYVTFAVCIGLTYPLGFWLEKQYRAFNRKRRHPVSKDQSRHVIFTFYTVVSFYLFFTFGSRPTINRFPIKWVTAFDMVVAVVGVVWFMRAIGRSPNQYDRERMSVSLRRQLHYLNLPESLLKGRTIEELNPDEVYVIAQSSTTAKLQAYTGVIKDLLEQGTIDVTDSFDFCRSLRLSLQLSDADHFKVIEQIAVDRPELLLPRSPVVAPSVVHSPHSVDRSKTVALALRRKGSFGSIQDRYSESDQPAPPRPSPRSQQGNGSNHRRKPTVLFRK